MPQPTDENVIWLTQEAYDRLQAELGHLRGPARTELAARIGEARDEGDLRENGGYHAAKEEQGKTEARIRQLEDMLRRAQVGETPPDDGVVEPGMWVTINLVDHDLKQEFLFGSREMAGEGITVFSPQSPLGQAINGQRRGDTVSYEVSPGKSVKAEILEAVPYTG